MANRPPVLIISDAPSSSTGLGRIAREIAIRADANLKDVCRIATLGCGGPGSRKFNFQQYGIEGMGNDFVIPNLPEVWADWAGNEAGIIFCIWDASRLGWFSRPNLQCENPVLKHFLTTAKIERWIYAPVDAEGPHGRLAYPLAQALLGFDRILAYGEWAEAVMRKSLGDEAALERGLSSIPHGVDSSVFYPRNPTMCRQNFFSLTGANPLQERVVTAILNDEPLIGTVATNQTRKDWGLWAESCALFLSRHSKARFWIHIDTMERHWSIPALLVDFGLMDRTVISWGTLEDEKMAEAYSACDLTLGIGLGEGFGFPIFESLFCGTPCLHGNYGGAPEHMGEHLLVNPAVWHGVPTYRHEGLYCSKRPVFAAQDWADRMEALLDMKRTMGESTSSQNMRDDLDWTSVWPRFDAWFRKGLTKAA